METVFSSPSFLITAAVVLVLVIPCLAHYWWKIRQAELDVSLKQEMLQRGMSAEDIQMVLSASSKGNCPKSGLHSTTVREAKNTEIRFENGAKAFCVKVSGGKQPKL